MSLKNKLVPMHHTVTSYQIYDMVYTRYTISERHYFESYEVDLGNHHVVVESRHVKMSTESVGTAGRMEYGPPNIDFWRYIRPAMNIQDWTVSCIKKEYVILKYKNWSLDILHDTNQPGFIKIRAWLEGNISLGEGLSTINSLRGDLQTWMNMMPVLQSHNT